MKTSERLRPASPATDTGLPSRWSGALAERAVSALLYASNASGCQRNQPRFTPNLGFVLGRIGRRNDILNFLSIGQLRAQIDPSHLGSFRKKPILSWCTASVHSMGRGRASLPASRKRCGPMAASRHAPRRASPLVILSGPVLSEAEGP